MEKISNVFKRFANRNKSISNTIVDVFTNKQRLFCFLDGKCQTEEQYEASITRLYHTVEKGLAYLNYRPGFGKNQIILLIDSLEQYSQNYDIEKDFYKTALSCLYEYIRKNKEYGYVDSEIEEKIDKLPGESNCEGGVLAFSPPNAQELRTMSFEILMKTRHSIRDFSDTSVDIEAIKKAVVLAQHTPSACNRQGWKTRIIADKCIISKILENQNGNRGFGEKIDKLLVITCDLRFFQKEREIYQVFIDGGMYAESVLNALFYYGVATVPLSASLTPDQEKNVRQILHIHDAEMLILFIGAGNYPEHCQTTKSTRKQSKIEVI